nr:retrovirus-related Pol polyprotein from transposon 17.6 [Tanacetum cinerariifolium]
MANQRTMAQLLQAPTEGYEDAIVVPVITDDNFKLKHGLLTLVQNKQFFGHDKEDPHAHVRYFNKITSTLKFLKVSNTSIKLMLFPFSLEGAARIWLEKEPSRSIFTWGDLVSKFINQFFPPSKTTNLRNEITNFQQRFDESFSEAWDRFKDILRTCPRHGFSELHQLDTFYNALNSKDQDSLNSAAGGYFLDKMPRECLAIIESKSKVRYSRNKPVVAKVSTNTSTSVEESCVTCGGAHSYHNFPVTDGNVYRDNIQEFVSQAYAVNYNEGNTSYRPSMMSNQFRPPGFPPVPNNQNAQLNQRNNQNRFIQNQNRGNNFNQGHVYQPLVFQPSAYQAPAYQAPTPQTQGVSNEDFSAYVKANDAVMRNMQTQGQNKQNQLTNLTDLITKFVNSNSASTSSSGTLPSNTISNPRSDLKAISTRSGVSYDGPQILPPTSFLPKVVEDEPEATKDTVNPTNNGSTEDVQPPVVQSESSVLPSEPVTSPIFEPVIALKLPEKLGDPGKFLIPCDFPRMADSLALADLGASINLMPFSMWKRLSLPDLTPTRMTLELADRSIPLPVEVAEDVYVKTGGALIDVFKGELTLRVGKEAITFNLDQTSRYSANYSDMKAKGIDVIDMACEEYSQEVLGNYMPEVRKELKICEAKSDKSLVDEPLEVELKDLPPHLEYAFLEGENKLPVIIAKDLSVEEKTALVTVLKSHKRAITWKLSDIEDQEKTTFTCSYERFAYRRMPFGLCNAPGTFQRCMMAIFHDMIKKSMEVFMDDFSIFRNSFQSCLSHLERMLKRCEDTNLCLNWEKSHFMVMEGLVLGHKISKQGIKVDKAKVDVITKLPYPTTVKVLGQLQDKHFRPIHYASKTMIEAESNYTTTEKEMLAVLYAFEKFRSYLIMNKSIVYTDHSALKYLFTKKHSKARLP